MWYLGRGAVCGYLVRGAVCGYLGRWVVCGILGDGASSERDSSQVLNLGDLPYYVVK